MSDQNSPLYPDISSKEPLIYNKPPPPQTYGNVPNNTYPQSGGQNQFNQGQYVASNQAYTQPVNYGYNQIGNQGYNQNPNQQYIPNNQVFIPNQPVYNPNPVLAPIGYQAQNMMIQRLVCPKCRQETNNFPKKVPGGVTWIWCFGLFFFTGILCCIPFCVDSCQDT
jgi:hypothetical protein